MNINLRTVGFLSFVLLTIMPTKGFAQASPDDAAVQLEFFEKKIRPILAGHCYTCHSAETNSKGGLRVDDRNGLLTGGGRGPAIVPGKPEESLLIRAVRQADENLKMPPEKRLADEQIADLVQWIEQGAVWPQESAWTPSEPGPEYEQLRKDHWAWQPLREAQPPAVKDTAWPLDDIDRFLLARLEEQGLKPMGDADKAQLIRRVTFDLTGLPPLPEDVEAFVGDASPQAYEQLVHRLLASPAFGERWGRHWLDVARYGESTGSARNLPYPHAWRYRDYVIRAFNSDKPYHQFLCEQIAGDLLPAATPAEHDEHVIATGFLALGVKDVNQRFKVRFLMDNIDEQIDTVSRSVLALTASCARCHHHKFDPIPQTDYYALAGIFHSTDLCAGLRNKMGGGGLDYYDTAMLLPLGPRPSGPNAEVEAQIEKKKQELAAAQSELKALQDSLKDPDPKDNDRPADAERPAKPTDVLQKQLAAARQAVNQRKNELVSLNDPAMQGPVAHGVREAKTIGDTEIRIRGEAERLGPMVPRGFLSLLNVPNAQTVTPNQSGRRELADWLTSPRNPLTPRVMANRIWKHLFGQGLVRSVDNFGVTGDRPSHPELLDHLAARFVRDGWSTKSLIRSIVLTRTYRLSADATAAHIEADPENRLVWRHSPRRLDAEEIRDAMLFAAGELDLAPPNGSPAQDFKVIELGNKGKEAKGLADAALESTRRSVYLPLLRGLTPTSLEVFDFAEQGMVTGSRSTTTVAPQALYLLNDPFVRRKSWALSQRVLSQPDLDDADHIRQAYELVLGRTPSASEVARAANFLRDYANVVEQTSQQPLAEAGNERGIPVSTTAGLNDNGESVKSEQRSRIPPAPSLPEDPSPENAVATQPKPLDSRAVAWASFCQALFGSAEFRFLK